MREETISLVTLKIAFIQLLKNYPQIKTFINTYKNIDIDRWIEGQIYTYITVQLFM